MDPNDGKFWSCLGRDLWKTCNLEGWSIGPYQYLKTTGQGQSKCFQVCWKRNWVATSQNLIFKLELTLLEGLRVAPDLSKRVELVCRTAYTTASQAKTKKGIAAIADGENGETSKQQLLSRDSTRFHGPRWSQMPNQSWKMTNSCIQLIQQCLASHPIGSRSSLWWEAMPYPHRPRLMLLNVATGSALQMYITYHNMTCS